MTELNNKNSLEKIISIITIVLLILSLFIPLLGIIGLLLMWFLTKWSKWLKIIISIPFLIIPVLSFFIVGYLFFLQPIQIKGEAMLPNYKSGQYLLTSPLSVKTMVNRGDVVTLESPRIPDQQYIMRIVGLPGERIIVRDGLVYINGQKLEEGAYLNNDVKTYGGAFLTDGEEKIIPQGNYFVMVDNRTHVSDSRKWGFVPREKILNKILFCYFNCK